MQPDVTQRQHQLNNPLLFTCLPVGSLLSFLSLSPSPFLLSADGVILFFSVTLRCKQKAIYFTTCMRSCRGTFLTVSSRCVKILHIFVCLFSLLPYLLFFVCLFFSRQKSQNLKPISLVSMLYTWIHNHLIQSIESFSLSSLDFHSSPCSHECLGSWIIDLT